MPDLAPVNLDDLPDPGDVPVLDWISVDHLDVEALYQRPEDQKRVHAMVKAFAWDKFGSLVVTPKPDGRYNVIDGQHRAQAAKLHPRVSVVPAVIITTAGIAAEATTFIGVNGDRKNVNILDLFFAKLAADDQEATNLYHVCASAGVDIAKYPKSNFKPRQTIAVSSVQGLISKRGPTQARQVLHMVAEGNFAPITGTQIKAVELLLTDPEFKGQVADDDLRAFLVETGTSLDTEAKRFAATHACPLWKGLASVWFQKCRKRRGERRAENATGAHGAAAKTDHRTPEKPISDQVEQKFGSGSAPRAIPVPSVQRNVTAAICGDPLPGRSALDQRSAGA